MTTHIFAGRHFSENESKKMCGAISCLFQNVKEHIPLPNTRVFAVFDAAKPCKKRITYVPLVEVVKAPEVERPQGQPAGAPSRQTAQPAQRIRAQPAAQLDQFWGLMQRLQWCDKDERKYDARYVASKLTASQRSFARNQMLPHISELVSAIGDSGFLQDKDDTWKANFYSHICGKGKDFYQLVLTTPDLANYMVDKYQPLWNYL